ncbi:MAG: hypothetical protein JNJ40_15515 [Bacteroidia bacterium]|nr:hypothetical protein [Bacteroidia bacterium]
MKKILLTLSLVALFAGVTKAQEPVKNKSTKKEVVNPDGTTSVVEETSTTQPTKKEEPKKSGTRMAINQKGTAGTNDTKKTTAKEEKTESTNPTSPTTKPH